MATKNAFAKALFKQERDAVGGTERGLPHREYWDVPLDAGDRVEFEARTGNARGRFRIKDEIIAWSEYDDGIAYNKYFEDQPEVVENEQE